ncbi:928_t:CDS:2, partial [Entrophospora sp. SA101]
MSTAVKWVDYDPDETYDLMTAFPKLQLPLHVNNKGHTKIAVCSSCKTVKNHHFPPVLAAIPEEIKAVPMVYCFIGLSKNKHALNLHSDMIGAFLDQDTEPPN